MIDQTDRQANGGIPHDDHTARQRLLESALELFNHRGYAATTVNQIVEAAGVTKPVLYYHFGNKEGIFRELIVQGQESMKAILGRYGVPAAGGAAESIRRMFAEARDLLVAQVPVARLVHAIHYGPQEGLPDIEFQCVHAEFHRTLAAVVAEGIRSGEFRRVDPDEAAYALSGILGEVMMNMVHRSSECACEGKNLEGMLDIVMRGLSAREGQGGTT